MSDTGNVRDLLAAIQRRAALVSNQPPTDPRRPQSRSEPSLAPSTWAPVRPGRLDVPGTLLDIKSEVATAAWCLAQLAATAPNSETLAVLAETLAKQAGTLEFIVEWIKREPV